MVMRSALDTFICTFDKALRAVAGDAAAPRRPSPAAALPEPELAPVERTTSARLMRVNLSGEVCAQALYHGQALMARSATVRRQLEAAGEEEGDHLAWCAARTRELGGRRSLLDPLWYAGAFLTGVAFASAGDRWSLGFLVETERQVEGHLEHHLERLPRGDARSRALLRVMKDDEARHGAEADAAGALPLPAPLTALMQAQARVMTTVAYFL